MSRRVLDVGLNLQLNFKLERLEFVNSGSLVADSCKNETTLLLELFGYFSYIYRLGVKGPIFLLSVHLKHVQISSLMRRMK